MKKNIVVTGGAGYIGSHACVELLNNDYQVIVIDNLSNSNKQVLQRIEKITSKPVVFVEKDIRDKQALAQIFNSYPIHAVMHFAGLKAVGESCEIPLSYYQNNVYGSMVLFEAMLAANVKKIIFSSSATVYAESNPLPYTETSVIGASNPYGSSKVMIEQILADMSLADKRLQTDNPWQIALLRYFNPIGAHESGLIGEVPNGIPNNLIPYVAQVAVGKLKQLFVFGDDYPTSDGTGVRDYIHAVDLVKGHLRALEMLEEPIFANGACKAYNLGTGQGYSVLEIISAFEKACGKKINYKISSRRAGDIAVSVADTQLAKQELGWQAQKTLRDMMEDTWRWQSNSTA